MATAFEQLQRASFVSYPFPVESYEVRGGLRDHVHEYPHSPGGAPEKLGRKLYEFSMVGIFDSRIQSYPAKLFPDTLATLRIFFEGQGTYDLVVPTIGTIQAYCTEWVERASSKRLSGVTVDLKFREDASNLFLVDKLVQVSVATLPQMIGVLIPQLDKIVKPNFLDQLKNFGDQISAVGDQVELQANVLAGKAEGLASCCQQIDSQLGTLSGKIVTLARETLHDVWDSAWKLARDAVRKFSPTIIYTVPTPMSVSDVSAAIYGDTTHSVDILNMNPIEDAFHINPGTKLLVYAKGV